MSDLNAMRREVEGLAEIHLIPNPLVCAGTSEWLGYGHYWRVNAERGRQDDQGYATSAPVSYYCAGCLRTVGVDDLERWHLALDRLQLMPEAQRPRDPILEFVRERVEETTTDLNGTPIKRMALADDFELRDLRREELSS